jgi:hypothetical protein
VRPVCGAAVVAIALLVAACGEGEKPEAVAKAYVGTNSASKCDMLSQELVESLTGRRGDAALEACRRNVVRFEAPKQVRVRSAREEGEGEAEGEAEVQLLADGREAELKLAKQDGEWRIVQLGE